MARNLKLVWLVGALALTVLFVEEAQASIISTKLSSWTQAPIVTGDATWNLISFTNLSPSTIPLVFSETQANGMDTFVLTLGDSSHLLMPGVYELKYSITLGASEILQSASLGAELTRVLPAAAITKYLYTSPTFSPSPLTTLTSVNGKIASTSAVQGLCKLYVDEIISVTGGAVGSITNTVTAIVPEPASLAVWALLGGGLIATLWPRRRMA